MSTFASERARQQVERLVDYVAFPGLGVLADPVGNVLVERGEVRGIESGRLAGLAAVLAGDNEVGAALDNEILTLASVPADHYGLSAGLRAGYRLCVVVPNVVPAATVQPRLLQVRDRLVAMMTPRLGGDGGPPREANALWTFAVLSGDSTP